MNILVIDNHDSFTFNLVYDLRALGCTVETWRNDVPMAPLLARAQSLAATLLLSPGPGTPADAGICIDVVKQAAGRCSVLGICLGHQAIVEALGGKVDRAPEPVHGRATTMTLQSHPLFTGLPPRVSFARYHSLAATVVPADLETIAVAEDGTVMAVAHRRHRIAGLQFHPESILSGAGRKVLHNALSWMRNDHA